MMRPEAHAAVYVCVAPVDMRKQAATLALIVEQTLKRNIFEPALYVFSNERRDLVKIVY
jgi:transposase